MTTQKKERDLLYGEMGLKRDWCEIAVQSNNDFSLFALIRRINYLYFQKDDRKGII